VIELPDEIAWIGPVFTAAFGLILGSFVNVVIHRLPLGRSVVAPRSRCPACGETIAAYDNIPLLSYLVLRGRCRRCRAPISLRYPVVELLVGAASLGAYLRHGLALEYVVELAFIAAMVALVFVDFDHRILPDAITLPGIAVGLAVAVPRPTITLSQSFFGAALGAGLLLLVAKAYFYLRSIEGMGMGDVKMMGMVGAFLGWRSVLVTLFLGSLFGSLVGLVLMVARGKDLKTALPFGTFLGVAAVATLYTGPPLVDWYSHFF